MKIRCHVMVSGTVQGVFFRSTTQHLAISLGVNGWVKNLPNGSLEAVLEGDEDAVDQMVGFFEDGPPEADVKSLKTDREEYKGEFNSFEIKV